MEVIPLEEVWKDIDGFPGYKVSSLGNVCSCKNNRHGLCDICRPLKPAIDTSTGYLKVNLRDDTKGHTKPIHKLVAEAFCDRHDDRAVVNHIDGDKLNNRADNLEWVSNSENVKHAFALGLNHANINHKPIMCVETGEVFDSYHAAARKNGGNPSNIRRAARKIPIDKHGVSTQCNGYHYEYIEVVE